MQEGWSYWISGCDPQAPTTRSSCCFGTQVRSERTVAFVGGIDLCHGRRDDARHLGDPQTEELDTRTARDLRGMTSRSRSRGPAIGDLDLTFRERWNDPTPMADRRTPWRALISRLAKQPDGGTGSPSRRPTRRRPDARRSRCSGPIPSSARPIRSRRDGERSIVRAYRRAFSRARCLIYVEDQYLWSSEVARTVRRLHSARRRTLRVMVVVPRVPDRNGPISGPPHRVAQLELVDRLAEAGKDRFAIYDLENEAGTPIYVHAKTVVIDDVWAAVGSDNLNRRSWTHDSELSIGVLDEQRDLRAPADPGGLGDGARVFARDLRITLLQEHLGSETTHDLVDPIRAFDLARAAAEELDAWHRAGARGSRPKGRLRAHRLREIRPWEGWWARPLYQTIVDPDGRPCAMKRRNEF